MSVGAGNAADPAGRPGWGSGIALACVILAACGASPVEGPRSVPPARWGIITLPSGRALSVELADTPALRERGYMFRERIPEGEGMIFLMGEVGFHSFWMKNCLTSLDIIWIDEGWRIVEIMPDVPPCKADPCPSYGPMSRSLYVLEVGPGEAARLGLKIGDRLLFAVPPSKGN